MSVQHEGREGEGRASVMEEHVCENGTVSQLTLLKGGRGTRRRSRGASKTKARWV
jgi:hypothetical protein